MNYGNYELKKVLFKPVALVCLSACGKLQLKDEKHFDTSLSQLRYLL